MEALGQKTSRDQTGTQKAPSKYQTETQNFPPMYKTKLEKTTKNIKKTSRGVH
jgi:hypothetical protein